MAGKKNRKRATTRDEAISDRDFILHNLDYHMGRLANRLCRLVGTALPDKEQRTDAKRLVESVCADAHSGIRNNVNVVHPDPECAQQQQ